MECQLTEMSKPRRTINARLWSLLILRAEILFIKESRTRRGRELMRVRDLGVNDLTRCIDLNLLHWLDTWKGHEEGAKQQAAGPLLVEFTNAEVRGQPLSGDRLADNEKSGYYRIIPVGPAIFRGVQKAPENLQLTLGTEDLTSRLKLPQKAEWTKIGQV